MEANSSEADVGIIGKKYVKGSSVKGSSSHFIFGTNVRIRRIRHRTTLNDVIFNRFGVDLEIHPISTSLFVGTASSRQ